VAHGRGRRVDGTVVSWNPAAERLYGYAASEMVGHSVRVLVPPDRPDEVSRVLEAIAAGTRVESYETVRVHRNGTRIDVTVSISPVVTAVGEVIGSVAIVRDISSRRHTDAALTRAIAQLERRNRELLRSNEELDSFAAVASHDLAQPLQVAYGFLDMLNTDYADQLPERGRQWLTSSLASLERMRNLVRDILRYARTGAGEPRLGSIPLAGVVDVAISSVAAAIDARSASVDVEVPEGLLVRGDPGQLALVFQNLVANAVKFVPPDRTPEVHVTADVGDHEVTVRVCDNGVGIPPDQRSKVFEMFQRSTTSSEGGYAGTGLGLAIVKKIVARHGGTVWADDADGGGTVIAVRLPVAAGPERRD
jgi:PAS domain S-box-containing protein